MTAKERLERNYEIAFKEEKIRDLSKEEEKQEIMQVIRNKKSKRKLYNGVNLKHGGNVLKYMRWRRKSGNKWNKVIIFPIHKKCNKTYYNYNSTIDIF